MARYKVKPGDFVVHEEPLYPLRGEGAHTFLELEKRGRSTDDVAADLARYADVGKAEVGYAGRKDRWAVTRQWFSVRGLEPERARLFAPDGVRVLQVERHSHKLRAGQLRGNRFWIRLRDVTVEDQRSLEERLPLIQERGFANRFGAQRFGRQGGNVEQGARLLGAGRGGAGRGGAGRKGAGRTGDRRADRFQLSALQSELFNRVLSQREQRYADGEGRGIDRLLGGDLVLVHRNGLLVWVEDPSGQQPRADLFEVSPTGPIFGGKMRSPRHETLALEQEVLASIPGAERLLEPRASGIEVAGSRRALRARAQDLRVEAVADAELTLGSLLEEGVYATVLLEELFVDGQVTDMGPRQGRPERDD